MNKSFPATTHEAKRYNDLSTSWHAFLCMAEDREENGDIAWYGFFPQYRSVVWIYVRENNFYRLCSSDANGLFAKNTRKLNLSEAITFDAKTHISIVHGRSILGIMKR